MNTRFVRVAVVSALALLAAACTADRTAPQPDLTRLVTTAATKSTAASARTWVDVGSVQGEGDTYELRGAGVYDSTAGRGVFLERTGSGPDDLRFEAEIRTIGPDVFVREPGHYAGRPWSRMTGTDFADRGDDITLAYSSQFLAGLVRFAGHLVDRGASIIRGVPARRVTGLLDLRSAAGSLPRQRLTALRPAMRPFGGAPVPVSLWIDGAGRLRRLTLTSSGDGAAGLVSGNQGSFFSVTVDLYDYGAPVRVVAPNESQLMT